MVDDKVRIYRDLVNSEGFKDLEYWVKKENETMQRISDSTPARDFNQNMYLESRGIRIGLNKAIKKAYLEAEI